MLKRILHRVMAYPFVYDAVQRLVGSEVLYRNLMEVAQGQSQPEIVLDLGGGTGVYRNVWKNVQLYISLDNDMQKAVGFKNKFLLHGAPLLADAAKIPLKDNSIDIIQCTMMSHHLQEGTLSSLINESFRVLKNNGSFIFMDACWFPESRRSRFLWSVDRGSYPKSKEMLLSMIGKKFKIIEQRDIRIHHSYLLCVGKKFKV